MQLLRISGRAAVVGRFEGNLEETSTGWKLSVTHAKDAHFWLEAVVPTLRKDAEEDDTDLPAGLISGNLLDGYIGRVHVWEDGEGAVVRFDHARDPVFWLEVLLILV